MAAATVNSFVYGTTGNRRYYSANINVANTNTLATGFSMIDAFSIDTSAQATLGATVSGGTLTFNCSTGDAAASLLVFGV
jgi:hypothetical protein